MKFDWAPQAYRALNGVFCVYKPSGMHIAKVTSLLKQKLVDDLNRLPCYKHERNLKIRPSRSEDYESSEICDTKLPTLSTVPAKLEDLSEHRLVLGPRFITSDIPLFGVSSCLSKHSSGVQVFGIGRGIGDAKMIRDIRYIRVYHVTGQLGMATDNLTPYGKIIERTTFHHVTKSMIDKLCASSQAGHNRLQFEYARVNIQSQEAYEMASRGIIRPTSSDTPPLLYGIKCIEFNLPFFTLEIHAINETATYFQNLIHDIGLSARSTAVCSKILRLRYGHFTLTHALLRKHWSLEHILDNMRICQNNLDFDKLVPGQFVAGDLRKYLPEDKHHPKFHLEGGV